MKIINIIIQFYYKLFWSFLNADIGIIVQIKCVFISKDIKEASLYMQLQGRLKNNDRLFESDLNQS